jgi:protease-4
MSDIQENNPASTSTENKELVTALAKATNMMGTALEQHAKHQEHVAKKQKQAHVLSLVRWGVIGLGVVGYLGLIASASGKLDSRPDEYLAVVPMYGEIAEGKDMSADVMNPLLRASFEDKHSKAVVLYINSPGGSPVQSSLIYNQIMRLKKEYNKKVFVVGKDLVASGGYYIASAADTILVDKSTIIGSIGVISGGFGFTGAMEKLGIERRVITAGESKNLLDPFSPASEKGKAVIQGMTQEIHENFKEAVKAGRGTRLKVAETPDLFSGRIWTGTASLKVGIADGIGDIDTVKQMTKVKEVVVMQPTRSPFENLFKGVGTKMGASLADGAISQLQSQSSNLE